MQAVQVSWVGKTFALARCSGSGEKKPRSRRTKEERRTMVESFIKNYRNLNNGKFPSLNLTHKEVGGSFYTVREIVREIIQDNRVLGPGNSSSKSLNLEYCGLEEHGEGSFSQDISDHLSISTISHAIGQIEKEDYSSSNPHQRIVEESITQETFASHPNNISLQQVMFGGFNHKDFSSVKPSGEVDGSSQNGSAHPISPMVEQPLPLCQTVSVNSSLGEFVVNGDDTGNGEKDVVRETDFSASSSSVAEIVGKDCLPEENILLDITSDVSDQMQFSDVVEVFPIASAAIKTCNKDSPHETEELTSSLKVSENSDSANEVVVELKPFDKGLALNGAEPGVHSSSPIDEGSIEYLTNPVQQNSSFSESAVTRSVPQPDLQPNDSGNVIGSFEYASGESIRRSAKGTINLEVGVEHTHRSSSCRSGSNSSSGSSKNANEEPETPEMNPFWAAVKSLVAAVVKFWTE